MVKIVVDNTRGLVQSAGTGTTVNNGLTVAGGNGVTVSRLTDQVAMPNFSSMTAQGTGGALVANSRNNITRNTAGGWTLPNVADSTKGDTVWVQYDVDLDDAALHSYSSDAAFNAISTVYKPIGTGATSLALVTRPNGSSNDFLNITGAANGPGGVGTTLCFWFDGSNWCVDGNILAKGTGAGTLTVAFANS
jgi:hypothetical protein